MLVPLLLVLLQVIRNDKGDVLSRPAATQFVDILVMLILFDVHLELPDGFSLSCFPRQLCYSSADSRSHPH